jgi:hypothetical protein
MNVLTRASLTLLAAAATGALLWSASQFDISSNGGYWAAMGVIAAGGLLFGLAQLRGGGGSPGAMLLIAFLPILVVAMWIVVSAQPDPNTYRNHVIVWSHNMGIGAAVAAIAAWNGVVAFGTGLVLGLALEPWGFVRRRRAVVPAAEPVAEPAPAQEPVAEPAPAEEPVAGEPAPAPSPDEQQTLVHR